jgi:two-component system OmpR family response regulator
MREHEFIDWDDEPTRRTTILSDARVLIAEDDDALREMMTLQLLEEGCAVTEASDGDQALATIRDHDGGPDGPFDLVVLDVRMPGTSGLDVVRRLRAASWTTPVLFVTAYPDTGLIHDAKRLGAAVLAKPFALRRLPQVASEVLHRRAS